MNILRLFSFLSLFLATSLVFAQTEQELLARELRPRMSQIIATHADYRVPPGIPIAQDHTNFPYFLKALVDGAPNLIIQLEAAYPNATFAFLGRDTQLISDVVDAFYISRGQPGRVTQIFTSKPTLVGMSYPEIIVYLKHSGFDIENLSPDRPFIMIDTVSKGSDIYLPDALGNQTSNHRLVSGRQGRLILHAVYSYWTHTLKRNPQDLLKLFNFVGLQVSTFNLRDSNNQYYYRDISDIKSIQKLNKNNINDGLYGYNMIVPLITDTPMKFNEAGYDHYTSAWHGKFQPPLRLLDGSLLPNPGALLDPPWRVSILWIQHGVWDAVNQSHFQRQVDEIAEAHDVQFLAHIRQCKNILDAN